MARLLPAPAAGSAYTGVRGAGENGSRTYEAGGVTLSLTVDAEGTGAARRWMLLGLVIDEGGGEAAAGAAVRLLDAGQPAAETTLDEVGNFTFMELAAGVYDLELTLDERVVAVEGIMVGAAPA